MYIAVARRLVTSIRIPLTFLAIWRTVAIVNEPLPAIAYLRVSTDRQAEVGLGLDVQHEAIQSWAQQNGYVLVDTFRDEGVSGRKDLDDRPALLEAFQSLRADRAVALVVYRLDRLARDLILQEQLLAEV